MKSLVIVESPTKARTISRFLGSDFIVDSSYGHIRDLPRSRLGIDLEHNFAPHYIIPRKAAANVKRLKLALAKSNRVILATDEDREGEAIAWHLLYALGLDREAQEKEQKKIAEKKAKSKTKKRVAKKLISKPIERIVFHEITKKAIEEALAHPRSIDEKLVDAQQARRILDRLVGYNLSPFLWKKIYRGLSAGRVQSVAVRIVIEREREIQKFKPEEYWTIEADLQKEKAAGDAPIIFGASLAKIDGKQLEKFAIRNTKAAEQIATALTGADWRVARVERRATTKNPPAPFTTSTLQQEAFARLNFGARQTMVIAQQLYEGMDIGEQGAAGLITYMRTDSLSVSEEAISGARAFIKKIYGDEYLPAVPRRFKTKSKGAQEAHEAIRPTDPARTPESVQQFLERKQFRLYELIWRRFMATQMAGANFDATSVDISAVSKKDPRTFLFRATGQVMRFDGFLRLYPIKVAETILPELLENDPLHLILLKPEQHFTEPPPRYTEASLIKILEQNGIGRPSTYAPTIATIQDRHYVERDERKRLVPTDTGFLVNDMLVEHFPQIVDMQFTARMEEEFDEIAEGAREWQPVIREFYEPFAKLLTEKYISVEKHEIDDTTDEVCEKCGKPMMVRMGRFGKFLACSGFPECKNIKGIKKEPQTIGMKCPKCGDGDIVKKITKRKRMFYGCARYPECDDASWKDPRAPTKEDELAPAE